MAGGVEYSRANALALLADGGPEVATKGVQGEGPRGRVCPVSVRAVRLLRAHRPRGVAFGRLAVGAIVQRQGFGMAEHGRLRGRAFSIVGDALAEMPVEIPLGE